MPIKNYKWKPILRYTPVGLEYILDTAPRKRIIPKKTLTGSEENDKRLASGMSVVGGALLMIPTLPTELLGLALLIPDAVYDYQEWKQNPTLNNLMHIWLDLPYSATKLIPTSIDNAFSVAGLVDDAYSAITGENIEDYKNANWHKSLQKFMKNNGKLITESVIEFNEQK